MPPRLPKPTLPSPNQALLPPRPRYQCLQIPSRQFSSTPSHATRLRRDMFRWINGPGAVFKDPLPGSTNYLNAYNSDGQLIRVTGKGNTKDKKEGEEGEEEAEVKQNFASGEAIPEESVDDLIPFPMNRQFRSQPVLSDEFRDEIYKRVVKDGENIKAVSASLGVEMSRVGAVVRLKSVENEWAKEGKPLATPYARAVLEMLPKTRYDPSTSSQHESINDLPVHRATLTQIFHPVSESRSFTRKDAGEVFAPGLLPADKRIPHPELVEMEKLSLTGDTTSQQRIQIMREKMRTRTANAAEHERKRRENAEARVTKVVSQSGRWEFRFKDISVEDVGRTGRDKKGVGARYGIPHEDRKRGQIKIPKSVE